MDTKVFRLLLTISFLFLAESVFSQEWIPIQEKTQGAPVEMRILNDDASSYQVEVTINGILNQEVNLKQGIFNQLSLGTYGSLLASGEPVLPLISRLIAVPSGTKASVSIEEGQWTDIKIGTIFPAQISSRDTKVHKSFYKNEKTYKAPYRPKIISLGEEQTWRNIKNVTVSVCPFRYYPNENRLSVLSKFVLRVNFEPISRQANILTSSVKEENCKLFDNTIYSSANRTK